MANRVFVFHQSLKNYPRNFNNVNHKFRHVLTFPVNQKDNTVSSVSCIVHTHTHTHVPLLLFLEFSRNRHCAIFTFRSVGSKIARRRLNSRDQKFQENRCQQNKLAGRNLSSSSTVVRVTQERNVNTRFLAAIEIVTSWNSCVVSFFHGVSLRLRNRRPVRIVPRLTRMKRGEEQRGSKDYASRWFVRSSSRFVVNLARR